MFKFNWISLLITILNANSSLTQFYFPQYFRLTNQQNLSSVRDYESMTPEELGRSQGQCKNNFLSYITHRDRDTCALDDKTITHLLPGVEVIAPRKPPILVKCLQPEPAANTTTAYDNTLLMMTSVKEIVNLLKPIGNATKRYELGSCVLVLFYSDTCYACSQIARYINILPKFFPTLRIAAIDAFKFPSFNTEFGIVGLPTLLLFHQGRPIIKYYNDAGTYAAFITRHTGIKAIERVPSAAEINGPLPLHPIQKSDYILWLAWAFIIICFANYFLKSRLCLQIIEMVKRNWREAEMAQMEQQQQQQEQEQAQQQEQPQEQQQGQQQQEQTQQQQQPQQQQQQEEQQEMPQNG